jgi:hypothetical protein
MQALRTATYFSGAYPSGTDSATVTSAQDQGPLEILVEALTATGSPDFESEVVVVHLKPVVTSISPSSGAAGTVVTLGGHNFGAFGSLITVSLGGSPCTEVTLVAGETQLTCQAPAGNQRTLPSLTI